MNSESAVTGFPTFFTLMIREVFGIFWRTNRTQQCLDVCAESEF